MSTDPLAPSAVQTLEKNLEAMELGAQVVAAGFVGDRAVFALTDGALAFVEEKTQRVERVVVHSDGAILAAEINHGRILTGGDDGRVILTSGADEIQEIADEQGAWIDALAMRADGAIAWSVAKNVRAREPKGATKTLQTPSSARGLAFFPKGYRLAVAHYNGVSLWFPNAVAAPEVLEWKGSHIDVAISPDGKFVLTSMQENALHGWRLTDAKNMRMSGYPAKTRSMSWSHNGEWLATSGADACVIWPFQTKDGPMGRGPRECGVRPARVSRVQFHPGALVLAIGYEDGWLMLVRLLDGAEIFIRGESGAKDPITALAWDASGRRLAFGAASGASGVVTLPV